jgi:hypothetical protein
MMSWVLPLFAGGGLWTLTGSTVLGVIGAVAGFAWWVWRRARAQAAR